MSGGEASAGASARGTTAGALLRSARERQGLHIAALAASIKVTPRKLDALENDRYDELPDATFTRALAQTVCRALKIDPQPVLALLPHGGMASLENVSGSLNAPFRDRPGRDASTGAANAAIRPMVWAGGLLMLAALAVLLLPDTLWQRAPEPALPPPAAETLSSPPAVVAEPPPAASEVAVVATSASAAFGETVHSAPPEDAASAVATVPASASAATVPATAAPAPAAAAALVQLRTDEASWIEVRDAGGEILLSRIVQPGETVGLDGALPMRLTIGNAPATRLSFRGRAVDLAPSTRDTVARIELQ